MKNYFTLIKNPLNLFLLILLFTHCSRETTVDPPESEPTSIVSSNRITGIGANQMTQIKNLFLSQQDINFPFHDVEIYRLVYKTVDVDGNEIEASGAVMIPNMTDALPIVSYQHGTITEDTSAPSNFSLLNSTEPVLAALIASTGFIAVLPDYIGYGSSNTLRHPYEHRESLGKTSYDMLVAAKEFLEENEIAYSNQLFLTGYSEGGTATMALHQHIEQNSALTVSHSVPASGAYNKTAFSKSIMSLDEETPFLSHYLWVIDAYNDVYNLDLPWSSFVNEPYASTLESILWYDSSANLEGVSLNPSVLFTESFRDEILEGANTDFLTILDENSFLDWTSRAPMSLVYGTEDDFVYPLNTVTLYDALIANGTEVTLVPFEGEDHYSTVNFYIEYIVNLFHSLKNDE